MNEELDINDPMMKVKSSQVYISFNKSEFMSIPSFFSNQASKWNYFLAYVNLLADICMDRNS